MVELREQGVRGRDLEAFMNTVLSVNFMELGGFGRLGQKDRMGF